MVTKIGLDLGYANITLSDVAAEIYREPSVVLVDKETRRILSVGEAVLNSEDSGGVPIRPFKNGLFFDSSVTRGVVKNALNAFKLSEKIRCIVGVPANILPKQEKELFEMLNQAGADECFSVIRSVAAVIGAGYLPGISAVSVNVGAKYTELSVLHGGKTLWSATRNIGGEDFDSAVKRYVLEQGDVNISLSVARAIKEHLGAVWSGRNAEPIEIEGTLSLTGNKVKMSLDSEDIAGVFEAPLRTLIESVVEALEKIPYDIVEAVFENGIILTGGGAELYGLDTMMSNVLGVRVVKPDDAIDCVAKGLSRINNFMPLRMRSNNKNVTQQLTKYYESKKQTKK